MPTATIPDAILAVAEGRADRAIVPVESVVEGSVDTALDALLETDGVVLVGELVHRVRLCLVARAGVALEDVTVVLSHPQALAQCAGFVRGRLPDATVRTAGSTAAAVEALGASAEPWAALGTQRAASLYGHAVLAADVEDGAQNATRFAWVAPVGTEPDGPPTKTSVVFWGAGAQEPGWLVRCLSEFASRGVNLTRIESRPRRDRLGRYVFFVDLDGGDDDGGGPVASALVALRGHCEDVRTLGAYPAG